MNLAIVSAVTLFLGLHALSAADAPKAKAKPTLQYEADGIAVPLASADEPRVPSFGAASVRAAAKYLDDGAISWVRGRACINCHTTGPYMTERSGLTHLLGMPNEEILANFVEAVPETIKPIAETEKDGLKYYPGSWTAIWRSAGLAEWDKHVTGTLSAHTDRSLREMFQRQSPDGSFVSYGEVEIPHITTDYELTLQAARAITTAPGWLAGLSDADLIQRIDKMKAWMRIAAPKNDFDRILRLQAAHYLPDVVTSAEREAALALLTSKQHEDGGWSTRDMSAIDDWHFKMSELVVNLIKALPDSAKPESDPYMTAFAIVSMRQAGVPASDERIQRGIAWLKKEQRVSGRWWMHSLYRGNYNYITYIATVEAMKALALCDALPSL
ncbi:MAG: hypothetical protein KDK97_06140 [Verrucomicrobiales bacterium]|nr:hypothetical protein [Verrucomicrobiales bacterium]